MIRKKAEPDETVTQRKLNRSQLFGVASFLATVLALPVRMAADYANVLARVRRVPVIWLEFPVSSDTESLVHGVRRSVRNNFGRTSRSVAELIPNVLSLEYHEKIMASAGTAVEQSLRDAMQKNLGKYICILEGNIPTDTNDGELSVIDGNSALRIAHEVCSNSLITFTLGSSARDNRLADTAHRSVVAGRHTAFPGLQSKLVNLTGSPANVVNIVATIVYYLAYGQLPALDSYRRPLFAYGHAIRDIYPCDGHHDEEGEVQRSRLTNSTRRTMTGISRNTAVPRFHPINGM